MSNIGPAQLATKIITVIKNNGVRSINGIKLQEILIDLIDTLRGEYITGISARQIQLPISTNGTNILYIIDGNLQWGTPPSSGVGSVVSISDNQDGSQTITIDNTPTVINQGGSFTALNGLTKNANNELKLGGLLTGVTTIKEKTDGTTKLIIESEEGATKGQIKFHTGTTGGMQIIDEGFDTQASIELSATVNGDQQRLVIGNVTGGDGFYVEADTDLNFITKGVGFLANGNVNITSNNSHLLLQSNAELYSNDKLTLGLLGSPQRSFIKFDKDIPSMLMIKTKGLIDLPTGKVGKPLVLVDATTGEVEFLDIGTPTVVVSSATFKHINGGGSNTPPTLSQLGLTNTSELKDGDDVRKVLTTGDVEYWEYNGTTWLLKVTDKKHTGQNGINISPQNKIRLGGSLVESTIILLNDNSFILRSIEAGVNTNFLFSKNGFFIIKPGQSFLIPTNGDRIDIQHDELIMNLTTLKLQLPESVAGNVVAGHVLTVESISVNGEAKMKLMPLPTGGGVPTDLCVVFPFEVPDVNNNVWVNNNISGASNLNIPTYTNGIGLEFYDQSHSDVSIPTNFKLADGTPLIDGEYCIEFTVESNILSPFGYAEISLGNGVNATKIKIKGSKDRRVVKGIITAHGGSVAADDISVTYTMTNGASQGVIQNVLLFDIKISTKDCCTCCDKIVFPEPELSKIVEYNVDASTIEDRDHTVIINNPVNVLILPQVSELRAIDVVSIDSNTISISAASGNEFKTSTGVSTDGKLTINKIHKRVTLIGKGNNWLVIN